LQKLKSLKNHVQKFLNQNHRKPRKRRFLKSAIPAWTMWWFCTDQLDGLGAQS